MTDGPVRVGDAIAEAKAKLRLRASEGLGPDDFDGDELAAVRSSGLDELRNLRWATVVPARFATADLGGLGGPPGDEVRAWATAPGPRPNLVILGPVGVGKTHAAIAACRADHNAGLEVQFLPVVEMLDMLRPGGPEGALWDLCAVDRLVLDDLGHEKATDWTQERLGAVVNRRWLEQRPTIATSNLEPDDLRAALGERMYSRLVRSGAVVVRMAGGDRRRDG